jgi:C-terminal processing protease CtpA/Prc
MVKDVKDIWWKEKVWRDVERRVEDGDIVVLTVSRRTSESFYNYKTDRLFVVFKDIPVSYEESLERNVTVIEITAGAFQPFSDFEIEKKMRELRKRGYTVKRITL